MKYVQFGNTGIEISVIGLGTNFLGGHNLYENVSEESGILLTEEALDKGINYFDTADAYGFGRSEELLGQVLKGRRQKAVIATKGGIEKVEGGTVMNNKPSYLRQALEDSLRRLQTDYIDIYYIHWPDNVTPVEEAVGEMMRFKEEGKIRSVGVSNFSLEQMKKAVGAGNIDIAQFQYSMLERSIESDILPFCREKGISLAPYGPLAYGILGGKYDETFQLAENDWRNSSPLFSEGQFEKNMAIVTELKKIAARKAISLPNLALAWLLHQDAIDAVIPGAKRSDQVLQNIKAAEVTLSETELKEIRKLIV